MIGNINLEVSTSQAVFATAVSSKSIDLLARQDLGAERGLRMAVLMAAAVSPGLRFNVPVSFTDAGELVGLVAHGLPAQTPVVFTTITTTTGIVINTTYYVVTGATDNFQVSATPGGGALPLANNGTGVIAALPMAPGVACVFTDANDLVSLGSHQLPIGTPVTFPSIATTTGITAGNIYYVSFSDNTTADTFVLAPTVADAHAGTNIIALTTNGTGTLTVLDTIEFQIIGADDELLAVNPTVLGSSGPIAYRAARTVLAANINTGTDIITATAHGLSTGDPVLFGGSGTMPTIAGALAGTTTFYAIYLTANTYQVATSRENAFAGIAADISVAGVNPINYQIRDSQLAAGGPPIYVDFNERHGDIGKRWLGARYVVNGTPLNAGAFTTKFVTEAEQGMKRYPRAYEV